MRRRRRRRSGSSPPRRHPRRSSSAVRTMSTRSRGRRPSRPAPRGCAGRSARRGRGARCRRTRPGPRPGRSALIARAPGLEAALGVGEAAAQAEVEEAVVGAGDDLALGAADDAGAARQAGADREVGVAGDQRGDEGEEGLEPGREVDVHVGEDVGVAARPDPAQGPAAALLGEADVGDRGRARRRAPRRSPRCGRRSRCRRSRCGRSRGAARRRRRRGGGRSAPARPPRCRRGWRSRRSASCVDSAPRSSERRGRGLSVPWERAPGVVRGEEHSQDSHRKLPRRCPHERRPEEPRARARSSSSTTSRTSPTSSRSPCASTTTRSRPRPTGRARCRR